jgi:LytS/YehU family sensor histidine kinase
MKLLKAQLQPHFLFNTLNNIYYEAYKESPRSARMIERLSEMMRFFIHISDKDKISLNLELGFIKNYIQLEQIRYHNEIKILLEENGVREVQVPPMLLVPLVENIFKHGVNKLNKNNEVQIKIGLYNNWLIMETSNPASFSTGRTANSGTGIKNLRERLQLIFDNRFELKIHKSENKFTTYLKFPVE